MNGYPAEEDWAWYEKLPKNIQDRITRLFSLNEITKRAYARGYNVGYKAGLNRFKKLVVLHEYGEKDVTKGSKAL